MLDCCENDEGRVAMLQVDIANAFDRVRHDVTFHIMEHGGLGSVIFQVLKMAYQNCSTKLYINARLTDNIPVHALVKTRILVASSIFVVIRTAQLKRRTL